jgi:CHASE1-domain containing sensor protein
MNAGPDSTMLHRAGLPVSTRHQAPSHGRTAGDRGAAAQRSRWTNWLIPASVLVIGIVLSVIASQFAREETSRHAQLRFDNTGANAALQVERRFSGYFEVLAGLRALFHTVDNVSRDDFLRYSQALALKRDYPGFQVVNYAPYVPAGSKDAFEAAMQNDLSLPRGIRFAIDPPGARAGYHPFTLLEPLAENQQYLGKDIAALPAVRDSLERARDTGKLTSSARVFEPPGMNAQMGLAVRLPVYRVGGRGHLD